jgi:serine/threonine protein phosphatase PrpC
MSGLTTYLGNPGLGARTRLVDPTRCSPARAISLILFIMMEHSTESELDRGQSPSGFGQSEQLLASLQELSDERTAESGVSVRIGAASASEKANEDFFAVDNAGTAVVCDGVGSSKHGWKAASIAKDYLADRLAAMESGGGRAQTEAAILGMLGQADDLVGAEQAITGKDMASTASVVKLVAEPDGQRYAVIGNHGDSPVYRWRDGRLQELTSYHDNLPKREQRPALGRDNGASPQVFSVPLEPGDRLLVTSNGLRKNDPSMRQMPEVLARIDDPQQAAQAMVSHMNGLSSDARTAIILDIPKT